MGIKMPSSVLNGGRPLQNDTQRENSLTAPNYEVSPFKLMDYIISFFIGFAIGFSVLFTFYKIMPLSLFGGATVGIVNIFVATQKAMKRRKLKLRTQFFDLLEAMSVALRAGSPLYRALVSAKEDLALLYAKDSDIIVELEIIIEKFNNAVPLSKSFSDLAERSGLEDIASFASIYAAIEGKSGRADEIVRDTQQIISDKMEIEMEIETLMTAAKSEVNIMMFMPLVILGIIGYAGAGFMDSIYTTTGGRVVSTGGLIVFIISVILARKFSNVKL
jgi:tight adherence protein B